CVFNTLEGNISLERILKKAEKFQKRIARQIFKFNRDYVINTDQTGCEYRVNVQRFLSTKVFLGDFNKITHSYTAQYAITASGKLLPKVFLCMQEPKELFGCVCGISSFILCANCRKFICFKCFYDVYHPSNCSATK
ncbi:hypothetical protein ALC57_02615, partial [Trachymyrmex cornetzi]